MILLIFRNGKMLPCFTQRSTPPPVNLMGMLRSSQATKLHSHDVQTSRVSTTNPYGHARLYVGTACVRSFTKPSVNDDAVTRPQGNHHRYDIRSVRSGMLLVAHRKVWHNFVPVQTSVLRWGLKVCRSPLPPLPPRHSRQASLSETRLHRTGN